MQYSVFTLILLGCVALSCQSSINCFAGKQNAFCLASNNGTRTEVLTVFLEFTKIWVSFGESHKQFENILNYNTWLQTKLLTTILTSPNEIVCNAESFAYKIFTMALRANEIVEAGNFPKYKEEFGIDLPLAQCAFKKITKTQQTQLKKKCVKSCRVDLAKQNILFYSNAIFINLVSRILIWI